MAAMNGEIGRSYCALAVRDVICRSLIDFGSPGDGDVISFHHLLYNHKFVHIFGDYHRFRSKAEPI